LAKVVDRFFEKVV